MDESARAAEARRVSARGEGLELEIRVAHTRAEIIQCQYLIADVYNRHYGIFFSRTDYDLDRKIEPYPHRYVMGLVEGYQVAVAGLYLQDTYVERHGDVCDDEIRRMLDAEGVDSAGPLAKREYTKLVVRPGWDGLGIGRMFFAATHSRDFINVDGADRPVLLCCAKRTVFENLYDVSRVRTRVIKPFPYYAVHALYRSAGDPMSSRLIIPDRDIHPRWYNLRLPTLLPIEDLRQWKP